jgi:hypothetical protein
MTGQGVERTTRTAYALPSTPPAGAATPLPPHIQGAERRRACRWGLRVLVVGGLAGAAWLLTGAAAQAASHDSEPSGSLFGSVVDGDATSPVTGLLTAATKPLEAVPAHLPHGKNGILEVPRRVLTRPAGTVTEVVDGTTRTTVDTAARGVGLVLREVAGPLRLTGGPAPTSQRLTAVTDTVTRYARPAAELPPHPAVTPAGAASLEVPVAPANRVHISNSRPAGTAPGHTNAGPAKSRPGHVKKAGYEKKKAVAGSATAREGTPGGDGSAPGQLHLGDVSGTSTTSGPGTPTEGGCAAFLPAAIANSTMACQRLPIVSGVEVRRLAAEAPTVSPD